MPLSPAPSTLNQVQHLAFGLALLVAFLGLLVFCGWVFDVPLLRSPGPFPTPMGPVASLGFFLSGSALSLLNTRWGPQVWQTIAWFLTALGSGIVLAHLSGQPQAIQWVQRTLAPAAEGLSPIPIVTGINWLMVGLTFHVWHHQAAPHKWIGEKTLFVVFSVALLSLLGYLFGLQEFNLFGTSIRMAFNTSLLFMLLSTAFLCSKPQSSLVWLLLKPSSGGKTLRLLLPAAILTPVLLSWVRFVGIQRGWLTPELGATLVTVGNVLVFMVLVRSLSWTLDHSDTQQAQTANRLRNSEEKYRAINQTAADAILILDRQGQLIEWNPLAARLFGHPLNAQGQLGLQSLLVSPPALDPDLTGITSRESEGICQDGTRFPLEYSLARWSVPDGTFFTVIARDITERKKAEEDLKRLNESLDQRARDLNQDLVRKTEQLEFTNKELEAFAFSISHDLRTPLRSINGFSQALLEDYHDKLDQEGQSYLDRIRKASDRMGHLIDDILHLSRITRSEMRHVHVNLSKLAEDIIEELQGIQPDRKVEVTIEEDLTVVGDPSLMRMVVQNLLGNAWKFTAKTPNARIHFGQRKLEGRTVFFVSDNGAGFNMENANKLFGVFQRLHRTSEFEGNGVGLASVQRILHRHGGHITAVGKVGEGATFTFTVGQNGSG